MDALRKVYRNAQSEDFKRTVREVKNTIYNYNEMEQMVREATCNDNRDPHEMLLKQLGYPTSQAAEVHAAWVHGISTWRAKKAVDERNLAALRLFVETGRAESATLAHGSMADGGY